MTTLFELYDFLEKCDTERLIHQLNDITDTLSKQFGMGAKVRFLTHINKLENLHSVMKYNFENESLSIRKKMMEKTSNTESVYDKDANNSENNTSKVDNPEETKVKPNDKYKGMESGDIQFAAHILPYKVSYIRELCRKRLIPYEKPKGKYVFFKSKLEEWLQQNGSNHRLELLSIGKRGKR